MAQAGPGPLEFARKEVAFEPSLLLKKQAGAVFLSGYKSRNTLLFEL